MISASADNYYFRLITFAVNYFIEHVVISSFYLNADQQNSNGTENTLTNGMK